MANLLRRMLRKWERRRYPQVFTVAEIVDSNVSSPRSNGRWLPTRCEKGWPPSRLKAAWMVFTGRYDVLDWQEDA